MEYYAVGGSVRDFVLSGGAHTAGARVRAESDVADKTTQACPSIDSVTDHDFVVIGSTPQQMREAGFIPVGKAFPVFIDPKTGDEYALARREVKTGDAHTDFAFDYAPQTTIAQDAQRRDFTINALYRRIGADGAAGEVLDPTGRGLSDCRAGILRHVSDAFVEDPLRVMRCARFAAQLGFEVAPETRALLKEMVARGMLAHLSRERIDGEFTRALSPGCDSRRFLEIMHECGALEQLYPEIAAYTTCRENTRFHRSAYVFGHILAALDVVIDEQPHLKTAVVYHDIYKPVAYARKHQSGIHVRHDCEDALAYLQSFLSKRTFDKRTRKLCKTAVRYHMRVWSLKTGMSIKKWVDMIAAITRGFRLDGLVTLKELFVVCRADTLSDKVSSPETAAYDGADIDALEQCALDTFRVCHHLQARDLAGYEQSEPTQLTEQLRTARIEAVRQSVAFFTDKNQ